MTVRVVGGVTVSFAAVFFFFSICSFLGGWDCLIFKYLCDGKLVPLGFTLLVHAGFKDLLFIVDVFVHY